MSPNDPEAVSTVNEGALAEATVGPDQYREMTGEDLAATLDISTWETGVRALQAFERLEREVHEAEQYSDEIRRAIRDQIFSLIPDVVGAPKDAGVWKVDPNDVLQAQRNVLFNGLVEACDGNSHIFHTLPIQIIQIAVSAITYYGEEATWANRIFRRDIPLKGAQSLLDQTIELLSRRADKEKSGGRRKISEMMRRGVMTYMERVVLADKARGEWRLGHGNPLAYELLTGSGISKLVEYGVEVLDRLILSHKKFVFVPSETNKEHLLTIGDALNPLEYAIVSTAEEDLRKLLDGGYRGEWLTVKDNYLEPFCQQAGPAVITGVYRASAMAPAQVFYAHRDFAHEAALIAIADSVMQEHRGRPMLLDMADQMCRTYFGAETLNRPVQSAFAQSGEPYRYLDERVTRN